MKKIGCIIMLSILLLAAVSGETLAAALPEDGQYDIDVTLSGGSGRVAIESPAQLTVADGAATAVIIWSSPYYEYMLVDGVYYYPVSNDGNSVFEIPVSLDTEMAVSGQTVAMSQPHEIDYTLYFDSDSLVSPGSGGSDTIKIAVAAAAVLIVTAVLIFLFIKRKKRDSKHSAAK